MPWGVGDVDRFKKGLTPKQKEQWVAVANSALSDCLKKGGSQSTCEGRAIRMASGVVKESADVGVIYYGHTRDIMQHNIDVLVAMGYEKDVAKDIAQQIAGMPMPSEEEPEPTPPAASGSASATVAAAANETPPSDQTA